VALGDVELTINIIELFGMVFAEGGDAEGAARLLGASEAMREKAGLPIPAPDASLLEASMRKVRSRPDPDAWHRNVALGTGYDVQDALAYALPGPKAGQA
jgi:hypothetical protein